MAVRLTQEQFIEKCTEIYNVSYVRGKPVCKGSEEPIAKGCQTYRYFEQHINQHVQGMGCADWLMQAWTESGKVSCAGWRTWPLSLPIMDGLTEL